MDTKFQTSFIPKKPLVPAGGRVQTSHHVNFLSIIIVLILATALAGAAAVFATEYYLSNRVASMTNELAAAEASLNQSEISEWVRLDKRIEVGKQLLNNHLAVSVFFDLLQSLTLKTIQFKNFSYAVTSDQKVAVTMDGQADNFAALALQSDELAKQSKSMSNQIFSNIDQDKTTGKITFRFSALIDPSLISYKNLIEGLSTEGVDAVEPVLPDVGTTTSSDRVLPRTNNQAATSTNL